MPQFEILSLEQAMIKSATGRQAVIAREYLGYIQQVSDGQAGMLQASEGETLTSVRRRLGSAAKLGGKDLEMKRAGDELYFWIRQEGPNPRRRRTKRES